MSGGLSGWRAALKGNSSKHTTRTNEGAAVYLDSIREMVRSNFVDYAFFWFRQKTLDLAAILPGLETAQEGKL